MIEKKIHFHLCLKKKMYEIIENTHTYMYIINARDAEINKHDA